MMSFHSSLLVNWFHSTSYWLIHTACIKSQFILNLVLFGLISHDSQSQEPSWIFWRQNRCIAMFRVFILFQLSPLLILFSFNSQNPQTSYLKLHFSQGRGKKEIVRIISPEVIQQLLICEKPSIDNAEKPL
jgi:hypothetical protein